MTSRRTARTTAARMLAASLAVPALLLTGCGASADEQRLEAFCEQVPDLLSDITDDVNAVYSDPQSAPDVLNEAVGKLEEVQPPADAEEVWGDLVSSWRAFTDLIESADLSDPSANTDLAEEATRLQGDLVSAGEAVDTFGQENC
ncbi:hypothetical protein ACWKWC_02955 [Geodermatophilus nigrescens]